VNTAPDSMNPNVHTVILDGCRPEPLLSYLKGLGVFRLVAVQADPTARGCWRDDAFQITSILDSTALEQFFLDAYRPTPIITPWNKEGGFIKDGKESAVSIMHQITASTEPRFAAFRATIATTQRIADETRAALAEKHWKDEILRRCRNELPDEALPWLDAAVVLTRDKPRYPPLLGSGGNDGHFEFSVNYMYRLKDVLPGLSDLIQKRPKKGSDGREQFRCSGEWLQASLFGGPDKPLIGASVGQFDPGGSGGINDGLSFKGDSQVNPWDLIFALEGAMFFAATTTRQLTVEGGTVAAFPFTVQASAVGYASAGVGDEGSGKHGELWAPLWEHPTGASELAYLFGEGRATVGRRRAVNGVDFARAIASLGVDRGLSSFVRYGFLQRNGTNHLATPLERVAAGVVRTKSIDLINEIDKWLRSWRRVAATGKISSHAVVLRDVEQAVFDLAARPGADERRGLVQVLAALGRAERTFAEWSIAQQKRDRDSVHFSPLQGLSGSWLSGCENTVEVRLSAALASLGRGTDFAPLRYNLENVTYDKGRWVWAKQEDTAVVWGNGPLVTVLARVLERRCLDARREEKPLPLAGSHAVSLSDIAAFLAGDIDEALVSDLTWAFCALKDAPTAIPLWDAEWPPRLPRIYGLLKLLYWPGQVRDVTVRAEPSILPLLQAGRGPEAARIAERRLRSSGLTPLNGDYKAPPPLDKRLAAALLFPISPRALDHCARLVLSAPTAAF